MENLSFDDHVAACDYMGEENPKMCAWVEGPYIGALRVAYVASHKTHVDALTTGETDEIDTAWNAYCEAKNAFTLAYYSGQ
jgi:hypothetical protein